MMPPSMSTTTKHFIIATAGHVDHGKSALVKALTGTDPDRLPEEKKRQITIDLGFAELNLAGPNGDKIHAGVVDVPGHEDFVRNMIAGVGSIDLALFVVAADDGWMPQTEEHLQILNYLGVQRAVVALTKSDLGRIDVVTNEIREPTPWHVFCTLRRLFRPLSAPEEGFRTWKKRWPQNLGWWNRNATSASRACLSIGCSRCVESARL